MPINQAALHLLLSRAQYDLAATQSAALIVAGDRLGLYRALASGPMTTSELAERAKIDVRLIDSWLLNQVGGGYVTFDGATNAFSLTPEQAVALTEETSAYFLPATFAFSAALAGAGSPDEIFASIARMSRAKAASTIESFLSDEIRAMLENGCDVVDVGCGSGALLVALATRFPSIRALGIDTRDEARPEGTIRFEQADAIDLPAESFDLVLCIETLHEFPDPNAAATAMRGSLRGGGRLVVIEPSAGDGVASNLNTTDRLFAATNFLFCFPMSGGTGLGPLAGEAVLRGVLGRAGFAQITRRDSAMHLVLECGW